MDGIMIHLDKHTEESIRAVFPVRMSNYDMDFAVDWFLLVGVGTIRTALEQNPELTLGDLISLSFKLHAS